jgi:hypothetical protein
MNPDDYYRVDWTKTDPGAAPISVYTELEIHLPTSGRWAMWGERGREFAVLGLDDPALAAHLVNVNGYWIDAETAIDGFAKAPFVDQNAPEDFRRALIANYGNRADLENKLNQKITYPWEKDDFQPRR